MSRPRVVHGHVYYTRESVDWRALIQWQARVQYRGEPLKGALKAWIKIYRACKVTSRNYGDADNHAKAILDALNGLLYEDDAQIVELHVSKQFSDKPRAVIKLKPFDEKRT